MLSSSPMFIIEYDIGEKNDIQLNNFKAHIQVMWKHPKVSGITIWGYIYGSTWVKPNGQSGIIRDGQRHPAIKWLKKFKSNPNPPNDYSYLLKSDGGSYGLTAITKGRRTVSKSPDSASSELLISIKYLKKITDHSKSIKFKYIYSNFSKSPRVSTSFC